MLRQHLADARVGQDVHGGELRTGVLQTCHSLHREPAARHLGRALHEQHHVVLLNRIEDLLADLVLGDDHAVASVLILSAWMGLPGPSRWSTAWLTSRCCSSSERPENCGARTCAYRWSPPAMSSTRTSAPGRAVRISCSTWAISATAED